MSKLLKTISLYLFVVVLNLVVFLSFSVKVQAQDVALNCGTIVTVEGLGTGCNTGRGFVSPGSYQMCDTVGDQYTCCDASYGFICPAAPPDQPAPPPPGEPIVSASCGSTVTTSGGGTPTQNCTNCPSGKSWELINSSVDTANWCCGWKSTTDADQCASQPPPPPPTTPKTCGDTGTARKCGSLGGCAANTQMCDYNMSSNSYGCIESNQCSAAAPPAGTNPNATSSALNIFEGPTSESFAALNPLAIFKSDYADQFSSPAGIINRALLFVFPLAGLILFVMIVWGGFEMIYGATNSKSVQAGKQRITAAIIGFMLLFASFWIIQIVEYIFNLAIL